MSEEAFWREKSLAQMSRGEWESLCDGCALCCVNKLVDEDGSLAFTRVACHLLDLESCRCGDYANRAERVLGCLVLSPQQPEHFRWLPPSCAYRRLDEGRDLPWWHPLRSEDRELVHTLGISLRGQMLSEEHVHPEELAYHIVDLLDEG